MTNGTHIRSLQSLTYQNLERILDETWLKNNPNHTYNKWIMKPTDSTERLLLSRFDNYIEKAVPFLHPKTIRCKLRNWQSSQFIDTYYELEVGCFLIDNGFSIDFKRMLSSNKGRITPDIFLKEENAIVEVKTLHPSQEEEKGRKSGKVFEIKPFRKIKDDVQTEIAKYQNKGIKYPLIVIMCPDIIEHPLVPLDDFKTALYYQVDRAKFSKGTLHWIPDKEFWGLYYLNKGHDCGLLHGVVLWRGKVVRFFENPNVNENLKIPKGRFLDLLEKT